jgi:hypothetical protein
MATTSPVYLHPNCAVSVAAPLCRCTASSISYVSFRDSGSYLGPPLRVCTESNPHSTNKRILDEVAQVPSKRLRNKVAGCEYLLWALPSAVTAWIMN